MYKIEITADTLAELSGKVLSLASKLMTGTATEGLRGATMGSALAAEIPNRKTPPKTTEVMPEVVVVHSSIEDEPLEVVDLPVAETPTIDFDTEIRAPALKVVEQCGKPVLEAILASFGVVKASHLAPERLPELLAELNKALGK